MVTIATTSTTARSSDHRDARSACCGAPLVEGDPRRGAFPWRGRGWPLTAREERRFVADLEALCGGVAQPFNRRDVTALVNALRSGISVMTLLSMAPGLKPERLLAAHRELEWCRQDAVAAVDRILAERTAEAVQEHGAQAARLMPALMTQLELVALERPAVVADAIDRCEHRMTVATDTADVLEARVAACEPGCGEAFRLGGQLFDGDRPSVWSDVFYVPRRVADLVPERVVGLLEERSIER